MPDCRTRPPVPVWRGTRPIHAANSRASFNAVGAHAGDDGRGGEQTNAGDLGDSAGRHFPHLLREPSLDEADVGLQLLDSPELLVQAVHQPAFAGSQALGPIYWLLP